MSTTIKRILFYSFLQLIWQTMVKLEIWPIAMIPAPLSVASELYNGFKDMSLVFDILASFRHLFIGLAISLVIGTGRGVLLARVKTLDETVGSMMLALKSMPNIVWLPVAIIWFAFGETSIIFVVVIRWTFMMTINMRMVNRNYPSLYI